MTAATVSSKAIVSALEVSGSEFAEKALGRALEKTAEKKAFVPAEFVPDKIGIYLITAILLSLNTPID